MLVRNTSILLALTLCACASTSTRGTYSSVSDPVPALEGLAGVRPQDPPPDAPSPWAAVVHASSYAETDFDDISGAELEVSRIGFDITHTKPVDSGLWKFRFGVEESEYDVSGVGTFDDAGEIGIGATYIAPLPNAGWSWFGTATLNEGTGDGADFGDGTYVEGGAGVMYAISNEVTLGLALIGRTQLEEDAEVFPFPIIEWKISEDSRIGFTRSSDPSLGWTVTVNEQMDWYIQLQRAQRQYRIDDDVLDDAAFVDEETGIRTGVIYNDSASGFTGEVFVGAAQRTLFLDVDDDEVLDEDVDAAAFFGFAILFGF